MMTRKFYENNQINNINLNIYNLEKIIDKEIIFYISKEQFESDIDIKFCFIKFYRILTHK